MKISDINNHTFLLAAGGLHTTYAPSNNFPTSKEYLEEYIGLHIHRTGFYGLIHTDGSIQALARDITAFDESGLLTIDIEGHVELNEAPSNTGGVLYTGVGILLVNGVEIYNGYANGAGGTATWGGILGSITNQTDLITYLGTNYLALDGSNSPSANTDWGGNSITNVGSLDYTDGLSNGFSLDQGSLFFTGSILNPASRLSPQALNFFSDGTLTTSTTYTRLSVDTTTASFAWPTGKVGPQVIAMMSDLGGGGITSLNGLSVLSQTFATGTTGTDFGISSSGSVHTFNLPDASATNRGLLTSANWSSFNGKQDALGFTPIDKAGDTGIGSLQISNTTVSTNTTTGALVVAGGIGVAGKLNGSTAQFLGSVTADLGGFIYLGGTSSQFLKADGSLDSSGILLTTTKVIEYNNKDASTGIKSGGVFSIGSPTSTFNLTPVIGVIRNRTTGLITEVSTINFVNVAVTNIAIQGLTYIKINTSGAIIQQPTPFTFSDYEDFIPICVIIHPNLSTISEFSYSVNSINYTNVKVRNLGIAIGLINNEDNIITPNGANAKINISSGSIYSVGSNWDGLTTDGDIRTMSAQVTPTLSRITRTGATTLSTDIDSSNYDLGGVLTAIGGGPNQWVNHLITLFTSGIISVQYGQQLYNSYNEAIAGAGNDSFVPAPNIEFGLSRYWLTIKKGTTNLTTAIALGDARLKDLGKFGLLTSSGSGSGLAIGGTDKQIQYNNSGSLGGAFNWDNSTQSAQFGSSVVKGTIHVVTNADGKDIFITRYSSDSSASLFIGEKARGTESSPTALQSGDTFGGIGGRVYGTTGFSSTNKANVTFITSEIQTDTAQGNYISFNATTAGTTTRTEVGRLDNTGFTLNGSKLILGGALTTVGAFATTITATATTAVTLPDSGTLYGTKTGSITSAQLLNSLSDKTGTGIAVFNTSPTFLTSVDSTTPSFSAFSTPTTLNIGDSATTANIFNNVTTAQNTNISSGVLGAALTRSVNIGGNGAATSITNVNIGSGTGGANTGTISLNCANITNNQMGATQTFSLFLAGAYNTFNFAGDSVTFNMWHVRNSTGTLNIGTGATLNASQKTINLGTSGVSGSITNINIGSSVTGALGTITLSAPTIVSSALSVTLFNTSTTVTAFAAAATTNLFGTTSTQSLNIATGVNASGVSKTINLGINGASGSTTNVNIGSPVAGANGTINLYSPTIACSTTTNAFFNISASPTLFVNSTNVSICGGATSVSVILNLMYNPTGSGNTKAISIGTNGLSGSITNFTFGSSLAGALGTATFYSVDNNFQGSVAIGTTSNANTSSVLELNSTTKGFLPTRLTSGQWTAVSTPALGLFGVDTTNSCLTFYPSTSGNRQTLVGTMFSGSAVKTVNTTTAQTSIVPTSGVGSMTLKAATVGTASTFRLTLRGYISNTAAPFIQIVVKLGTVVIFDTTSTGMNGITGNQPFKIEALFTVYTTGVSGTIIGQGEFNYATNASTAFNVLFVANTATSVVDFTTDKLIDTLVTWSASSASNSITTTNCILEKLN